MEHSETIQLLTQSTAEARRPNLIKDNAFTDKQQMNMNMVVLQMNMNMVQPDSLQSLNTDQKVNSSKRRKQHKLVKPAAQRFQAVRVCEEARGAVLG